MSRQCNHLPVSIMLIVLAFFAVDSVISTAMLSNFFLGHNRNVAFIAVGSFVGFLAGQSLLVATWLALGAGPLAIRLPASLAIFSLIIFSWFVGVILSHSYLPSIVDSALTIAFCLVLFMSVTAPLWTVRLVTQRRIIAQDSSRELETREQFSLRYVFIVTACVALLVTLAKLIFGDTPWSGSMSARWRTVIALLVFVLAIGAYISLVALPLLWIILREPSGKITWVSVVAGAMILCPIVVSEVFFAIPGVGRPPPDVYPWIIGALLIFGFAVAIVTTSGFWSARLVGLRFVRSEFPRTNPL
jgi:hypothetical protein